MKFVTFTLKLFLIGVLPLLAIDGLRKVDLLVDSRSKNAYLAAIVDKMNLLASVPSPRLILMSGSSMAFGVDAGFLEKELEIPVINAALHFNLGSRFMVEQLKGTIRKGDIILMSLEYVATSEGQHNEQLIAADFYPPANAWIRYSSFEDQLQAYTSHRLSDCRLIIGEFWAGTRSTPKQINDTTSVFFRNCFGKNGDLLGHLNNPSQDLVNPQLSASTDFSAQIKDLNELDKAAKKRGATLIVTFPSYAETGFEQNMATIQHIEGQLRSQLTCLIIGTPQNAVMDDELFFDNAYHPTAKGRKIFTARLLQLLEQQNI